jgi:hypothetical protein
MRCSQSLTVTVALNRHWKGCFVEVCATSAAAELVQCLERTKSAWPASLAVESAPPAMASRSTLN